MPTANKFAPVIIARNAPTPNWLWEQLRDAKMTLPTDANCAYAEKLHHNRLLQQQEIEEQVTHHGK